MAVILNFKMDTIYSKVGLQGLRIVMELPLSISHTHGHPDETTIRMFPNNKPWVTAEVKAFLTKKKKHAFVQKDDCTLRVAKKELRSVIGKYKQLYRDKIEEQLHGGDARNAWRGFRNMMGMNVQS